MIYVNERADVHLPSRNGAGSEKITAGTPAARPSSETWLDAVGMSRSYVGVALNAEPADPAVFDLGARIVPNGYAANSLDVAGHPAAGVLSAGSYSLFGKVVWSDANGDWDAEFSVTGDGLHGSGATFVVESVAGAATKPVAAGSILKSAQGTLSLQFDAGAPSSLVAGALFFEPIFVSPSVHLSETNELLLNSPQRIARTTLVQNGDVGTFYVAGSQGMPLSVREFALGARLGDPCRVTSSVYEDTAYPTKATRVMVSYDFVGSNDLP